eukprot:IDg137t1
MTERNTVVSFLLYCSHQKIAEEIVSGCWTFGKSHQGVDCSATGTMTARILVAEEKCSIESVDELVRRFCKIVSQNRTDDLLGRGHSKDMKTLTHDLA